VPAPHGHFLAGEVGELAGVSGVAIGQWARWGYIRASQSTGDPHVYSVEDVAEAAIVAALLERGVRHAHIRRAVGALGRYGPYPLSDASLATTPGARPLIHLCEEGGVFALGDRGWQRVAAPPELQPVFLRLRGH
jgi:hypothetical protein